MLEYREDRSNNICMQDFFYSRNDQNKLIQNMVFEFVDDNLESLVERNVKAHTRISEIDVKVIILSTLEIYVSVAQWTRLDP